MMRLISLVFLCFLFNVSLYAQKRPLDHQVYDGWQRIQYSTISQDGQFILYSITPQQGDASLIIRSPEGKIHLEIPRGEQGRFTSDSHFAIAQIKPPYHAVREARIQKKKENDMPKDSLVLVNLLSQEIFKAPNIVSYKIPLAASHAVAYLQKADKIDSAAHAKEGPRKADRFTLHLRDMASGIEELFDDVSDYFFDAEGNQLAFVKSANDTLGPINAAGLYLYQIKEKRLKKISHGKGSYRQVTFDLSGSQLAFAAEKSPEKALQKPYALYYYTPSQDTASILAQIGSSGMPTNWQVSGDGALRFSRNGEKLFFGIAPIPRVRDTILVDFEVAQVDIWNWKDDYLQPQQLANLKRDLAKSYLSVLYPKRNRIVIPLASPEIPEVHMTDDANSLYVLGISDTGKRVDAQWEGTSRKEFYLISTVDGTKFKVAENLYAAPFLSPMGKYVLWYDLSTQQWNRFDTRYRQVKVLNVNLPVSFADEDNDSPTFSQPYGIAGWTAEDEEVLLYDKYDIWRFGLKGNDRELLTNGFGRSNGITFRYEDILPKIGIHQEDQSVIVDLKNPLFIRAFNQLNKEHGWYQTNPHSKKDPKELIMGPYTYRDVATTADGKSVLYTKENYQESPDLYVASSNMKNETKLSAINPQQAQYNWGTAELVRWTTPAGYEASGILYKPEDFDASKKYPLIAYFYEKLSDGLYTYIPPAPTPSRLNISYFVSNGYLVFTPDIRYEIGHPGKSAEEFVNSGVTELSKFSWIDEKHIGIQGQSWGGYQVAHLITRSHLYAAAWAGAPVANMTSAYGGIRWSTGLNRQFQYEKTQSRIGKDLWDGFDLYIENSPLFHLKNVQTPLAIMANDQDGAVPWYQGIELFTALRRLHKPAWLLVYNGEDHNLVKRQNRKDIQVREQQFFDHFLKGKPAPIWLERGVPATLKGIDWGVDLIQ